MDPTFGVQSEVRTKKAGITFLCPNKFSSKCKAATAQRSGEDELEAKALQMARAQILAECGLTALPLLEYARARV